ncbi:ABC transporter substrate-binding protein [Rhodopseudomonas palustris]|uniref:Branched-chain amino acid ABC transporter substrate-binding protein n=1 Tax=Rhodopseudomonas palustris TaxID=1076 RepID=A0A418V1K5_RHOPL|nr:ABC transporter substrate-binding protein [Rhodopseudomonas palustris]RJF69778.1 branched-chain amino acid ABC transporter substrate-binding protein [Rhodopseudomonas palustris]
MRSALLLTALLALVLPSTADAQGARKYGPGVTDTEIKIGNIMPYSGPASSFGNIGKAEAQFFKMINDNGGINGRKINFVSYDDGYSPPKTVEQARKLVEDDEVLFLFNPMGTAGNSAIRKYLNQKMVPQLFVGSGATKFNDPSAFPWTMGWLPSYQAEARIYAQYILKNIPDAKIGILYQNDDLGKDFVQGLNDGLGGKIKPVMQISYEFTDPTVDSQISRLQAAGVNVLLNASTPKFAAQAIRRVATLKWDVTHFLVALSSSVGATIRPAGPENAVGLISSSYAKDPTDPNWADDPGFKRYQQFITNYLDGADKSDPALPYAFNAGNLIVKVLQQCGDELTRENVMKQAADLKNVELDMLLPGIKINTSASDYEPIDQVQMMRFDGASWVRFGDMYTAGIASN